MQEYRVLWAKTKQELGIIGAKTMHKYGSRGLKRRKSSGNWGGGGLSDDRVAFFGS